MMRHYWGNQIEDSLMSEETVKGKDVTIRFDAKKCIHSRGCVLGYPNIYQPNVVGEWIHPDAGSSDEVMHTALNCPSGAIRVAYNDGSRTSDHPPVVNTVRVRENGPLAIEAELLVREERQVSPRATLCRCGQSKNKPYCDGAHAIAGFVATGEPAAKEFTALDVRNGPVKVQPLPNGPLMVTGNLEIVSGTGRTTDKVTRTALCRCGQSKNKPYCDGSHKAAGFTADWKGQQKQRQSYDFYWVLIPAAPVAPDMAMSGDGEGCVGRRVVRFDDALNAVTEARHRSWA
jgi:CDGSH-type Zn-finger protein/uncharacterized Fe-S cluster protein YjdI